MLPFPCFRSSLVGVSRRWTRGLLATRHRSPWESACSRLQSYAPVKESVLVIESQSCGFRGAAELWFCQDAMAAALIQKRNHELPLMRGCRRWWSSSFQESRLCHRLASLFNSPKPQSLVLLHRQEISIFSTLRTGVLNPGRISGLMVNISTGSGVVLDPSRQHRLDSKM